MCMCMLHTAGIDNADSRRVPDKVVDRFPGSSGYIREDRLVLNVESERHGTIELSGIFNV